MTLKVVVKRLSISFPEDIWEKLEQISERQHRSIPSVIVEACDRFLKESETRESVLIAEQSADYKAILKKIREDLGLPPHPQE